ncbi:hypothetical protein HYP99_gp056 [Sinorhizobium phage ort11]|uniref:Uncharacterized protein n=1 Tax=Sinorhizobium phage ort11 TaxID=2599764 RepID=A0A5C2H1E8_9CAUD|nr:hypothetical protein HYP99_gp056 [Sinorhizobium phage ort11]QEP29854.1 hypothetical protein Smphiort11_056 [Sinorhizobium phage ort11]
MSIHQLSKQLTEFIFQIDEKRLEQQLETIKSEDNKLGGLWYGFTYGGEMYTHLAPKQRRNVQFRELDPSLHPKMQDYLLTKKIMDLDRIKVTQTLSAILIGCTNWQDVRDSLPEGIIEFIPQVKDLPRTREEAFNIVNNERAKRQYEKNSAIIAKYLMARYML